MPDEKQTVLFERYSALLRMKDDPSTALGASGIQVGEGWYRIVEALLASLAPLYDSVSHLSSRPEIYSIENRGGRLYVLLRPLTGEMDTLLRLAAEKSAVTCERCGVKKELDRRSTCDACAGV